MDNKIKYKNLKENEIDQYSNIIINVINEFNKKDYSEEGYKRVIEQMKIDNILERLKNGLYSFFIAKYENEIIGILEIQYTNIISLFYVKKDFHKQGIGKKLFEIYLNTIKDNTNIKKIYVHSSIYAEKIYSALGFIKTNEIQEIYGINYIPMEYLMKK